MGRRVLMAPAISILFLGPGFHPGLKKGLEPQEGTLRGRTLVTKRKMLVFVRLKDNIPPSGDLLVHVLVMHSVMLLSMNPVLLGPGGVKGHGIFLRGKDEGLDIGAGQIRYLLYHIHYSSK